WGDFVHSVRTGKCAYEHRTWRAFFDDLDADPGAALTFSRAMTSFLQSIPASVVEAYDFSPFAEIVDVGAAHGALPAAILKAHPQARAVLFDRPQVIDRAREVMAAAGGPGRWPRTPGAGLWPIDIEVSSLWLAPVAPVTDPQVGNFMLL